MIILLQLLLPIFSCQKYSAPITTDKTTLHIDHGNEELANIAANARDTLPEFFRRLIRPAKNEKNFMVKYPFRADRGSGFAIEQLWLANIKYKDGVYYGVIVNAPYYLSALKKGDTVAFSIDDITDWMYTANGIIHGGFSIKYLLDQIPEHNNEHKRIIQQFSGLPDFKGVY
jgi:uncharacterized protein YegJ (DUF2314 family)